MNKKNLIYLILILLVSCDDQRLNLDGGIIPPVPVNFSTVNSVYDDYNSDLDIIWSWKHFTLIFSTNRYSAGHDFDFVMYEGYIESELITGKFDMTAFMMGCNLLDSVNSSYNELGPFLTHDIIYNNFWKSAADSMRFFYSTDIEGNLDIYCCHYSYDDSNFSPEDKPAPVALINTGNNEAYLTIHKGETQNRETVYFTSDRGDSFDIYRAVGDENMLIEQSEAIPVSRVDGLSSGADDKCPFIYGNVMVFTSDREGGYGGFDLWYSVYDGEGWSDPVNFGATINSEYDEYRPVVVAAGEAGFLNDLMVFSSNRPGGKGGFDLYYAGIKRL
jgi:hypothetical protein